MTGRTELDPAAWNRIAFVFERACNADEKDRAALLDQLDTLNRVTIYAQKPHWLDYDPLALAVLVIGIGIIELLVLII